MSNLKFFVRNLLKNEGKNFYIVDSSSVVDDFVRVKDGSIFYPNNQKYNFDKVKEHAINFAKIKPYSLANFDELSYVELFEEFVTYLKLNEVNVTFFLPPYNPISYDLLIESDNYNYITIAEKYLIDLANNNDFDLKGSYNPHKYGFGNEDFFDGVHGRDQVIKKIFQPI